MRCDNPAAIAYFRQALQIAQEHPVIGKSHLPLLGLTYADPRTALLICEQELARQRALDDLEGVALTLQLKAQLLLIKGDYARAEATLDECLALWRRLGVRSNMGCGISKSMQDLGLAAWLQGDIAVAKTWYEQSLEQFRHAGDMGQIAKVQVLLGHTMLAQADLPGASAAFHQGLCFFHERTQPPCVALALAGFGAVAEAREQAGRAAQLFAAASAPSGIFMLPTTMWPAERSALQREIAAARSRFAALGLATAWTDGEHMSLDQAVEYALNEAD